MTTNTEYIAFVNSLTYGAECIPMSVEDAEYTLATWKEEDSVEAPEGFTAEIFAELWNAWVDSEKTT